MFTILLALSLSASAETLSIDASTGSLRVLLFKDGPLAVLGHDHVVRAPAFTGSVELSGASAQLILSIDAKALQIDEDAARQAEGLNPIKASDRVKIDLSMRGPKGLDVEKFTKIELRSQSIEPVAEEKDTWHLIGHFLLHGSTQTLEAPVLMTDAPGGRWFTGYVRLRPSDFGIKPFSVAGGAVRVKDEALVKFTLFGKR